MSDKKILRLPAGLQKHCSKYEPPNWALHHGEDGRYGCRMRLEDTEKGTCEIERPLRHREKATFSWISLFIV